MPYHAPTVALLGDVNLDLMLPVCRIPPSGQEAASRSGALVLGGSVVHTARWLSALGVAVRLVGCVGDDPLGEQALGELRRAGVPTKWLQRVSGSLTGVCCVMVEDDGQRTMLGLRGANACLARERVDDDWLNGVDWLHLSGYALLETEPRRAALWAVEQARVAGVPVSLDPGMVVPRHGQAEVMDLVGRVDLLLPNAEEAEAFTGEGFPERAALLLVPRARTVLVKCGRQGCVVASEGTTVCRAAPTVEVSDSTGAGDAFDAGAIAAALCGGEPHVQGVVGNLLGALAAREGPAAPALGPDAALALLDGLEEGRIPRVDKEEAHDLLCRIRVGGTDERRRKRHVRRPMGELDDG